MKIADHEILRERGHWVEEGRLYSPLLYPQIIEKLEHLINNPESPSYSIRYGLRQKRIRIDKLRIYVQLFESMKMLTIVGVVYKNAIAADDAGTIDSRFLHYLRSHQEFLPHRFVPMLSLNEYNAANAFTEPVIDYFKPLPAEPAPEPSLRWGPIITASPLTEVEAAKLLLAHAGISPLSRIEANMIDLIQRAMPGDKVMVPLPPNSDDWEKWQIRNLQSSIKQRLAVIDRKYSVRFDDFSRKFILMPPDKIQTYAWSRVGRLPKTVQEVQNAAQ